MSDDHVEDRQDFSSQVRSIPPERAERLRVRRPGYDQVLKLVLKYNELSPDKLTQMSESDLSESYIQPLFEALGWSVEVPISVTEGRFALLDFELEYKGLRLPVEVKGLGNPLELHLGSLRQWRGGSSWGILTNFEIIQIWDLDRERLVVDTSPFRYIVDGKEEHDLLAASVFYEKLAHSRFAASSTAAGTGSGGGAQPGAAEATAESDNVAAVERLIAALSNPNESVRQSTVEALGKLKSPRAVEPLIAALSDSNESIRLAVVRALGEIGDSRAVESLITALSDPNESICQAVIEALGRIGDPLALRPLMAFISDPNDSIRLATVEALSRISVSQAAEPLTRALEDENASVQQAAAAALAKADTPSDAIPTGATQPISIAVRALADTPSEVDLLGFSVYAEALADFIKNERTEKPLTIGIDAAWGMGKTTLMRMIRDQLMQKRGGRRKRSFLTVWFNAWKYDQEESLWAALALEILAQIRQQYNWRERARLWVTLNLKRLDRALLWRSALKLLLYAMVIYLLGAAVYGIAVLWLGTVPVGQYIGTVGVLGFVAALYAAGKEVYDRITGPFDLKLSEYVREPNYKERVGFLAEFEEDFARVIEVVTEGGKWPLVVFIDDLDRCAPPKPAEIIEAINILLDAKHCVFVIGMDAQTVAGSIEAKYKDLKECLSDSDDPGGLTLSQRFLEKIVQISFHIPTADPETIVSFVHTNLGALARTTPEGSAQQEITEAEQLIKAEQRVGKTLEEAVQTVQADRPDLRQEAVVEARREIVAHTFDDSEQVRSAVCMAAPYLGYNPRKIKRFINIFRLEAFIANRRGLLESKAVQLDSLAKWIIVALRWPVVIAGMKIDRSFVHNLLDAHETQEKLRGPQPHTSDGKAQERLTRELENRLGKNQRLRQLLDASDLISLLKTMTAVDMNMFPYYLHLARVPAEQPARESS